MRAPVDRSALTNGPQVPVRYSAGVGDHLDPFGIVRARLAFRNNDARKNPEPPLRFLHRTPIQKHASIGITHIMVFHNIDALGADRKMAYHNLNERHPRPRAPVRRTI